MAEQALMCLQIGYWQGAIDRCNAYSSLYPHSKESVDHIAFLANTYSSDFLVSEQNIQNAQEIWNQDNLIFRFYWYDLLILEEKDMLLNAEWAMFNTPTADYSMALAQWWRLLESILKRTVAKELSELFSKYPEWLAWDIKNLSKDKQEKEKVFLKLLADQERAKHMTLGDLLLVLKKCVLENLIISPPGSRLRMEASKHLVKYAEQLLPLMKEDWLRPVYLTNETISMFRNKASHDSKMSSTEAFVGRAVARRFIDSFFSIIVDKSGLKPKIVT